MTQLEPDRLHSVAIILGSKTDEGLLTESKATDVLSACGVSWELSFISTHRNPKELTAYVEECVANRGTLVFIAAAGGSAGLPGTIAGITDGLVPVIGIPLPRTAFPDADDALKSVLHMPPGTPVPVPGIGEWGFRNAAVLAAQIVAVRDKGVMEKLREYRKSTNKQPVIGARRV